MAQRLDDVLQRNRMTEKRTTIRGRIGTASDIRNRVEIQSEEGPVIGAKVADDVVPSLADYFTHLVEADVIVTTVRSAPTGQERLSYLVMGLSTMPEQQATSPEQGDDEPKHL